MVKSFKKQMLLKVLQVACANEEGINKTSKMEATSVLKSIQIAVKTMLKQVMSK